MPVTAAPMTAMMMTAAPLHVLGADVGKIILIGNCGFRGCIRFRLRAVHQILLRGQHRRCTCSGRSRGDCTRAGSDAERELQEITTFHQFFSL